MVKRTFLCCTGIISQFSSMNLTFILHWIWSNGVRWIKYIKFCLKWFFSFFDLIAQNRAYIRIKCIYMLDCDEFKYAYAVAKSKFIRVTNCQNSYQICEIQKFHHNTWVVRPSTKLLRPQNLYDFIIKRIDLHIYDLFGILANNPSFCLSSTAFYLRVCTYDYVYLCVHCTFEVNGKTLDTAGHLIHSRLSVLQIRKQDNIPKTSWTQLHRKLY